MRAEQLRLTIDMMPRRDLDQAARAVWAALVEGQVDEGEAAELHGLIEARRKPAEPHQEKKRTGSRPRSPASMERRRRWCASGRLPPAIACKFTLAEAAVLAVVAVEVVGRGDCRLTVGHVAALAGVSDTTVRNALREARKLGLVTVEERRLTWTRNDSNVVRIVSAEWSAWLRLRSRGGGCKSAPTTGTMRSILLESRPAAPIQGAIGKRLRGRPTPH